MLQLPAIVYTKSEKMNNKKSTSRRLSMAQKRAIVKVARRRGDVTRISNKTGFAISTVSEVLSGKYNNERIVDRAYQMVRDRRSARNARRTQTAA